MLLATAIAAVAVFAQEPAPTAPQENPVHTEFRQALTPFREAAGVHLVGSMELWFNGLVIGKTVPEGQVNLHKIGTLQTTVRWAKPHYGTMKLRGKLAFNDINRDVEIEQIIDTEVFGTAKGIYSADHDLKTIEGPSKGNDLVIPVMQLEPFSSFLHSKTEIPTDLKKLPADEAHAKMQGWSWTGDQGIVHLWLKDGVPNSYTIDLKQEKEVMQRIVFQFAVVELKTELAAESYIPTLPKDYLSPDDPSFDQ